MSGFRLGRKEKCFHLLDNGCDVILIRSARNLLENGFEMRCNNNATKNTVSNICKKESTFNLFPDISSTSESNKRDTDCFHLS
jgi:hypothetical protein